jgi:branched-chain amino acid transport system substrate-binding protein
MKKIWILACMICTVVLFADPRPVFKIGAVLPLSGNLSALGQEMRDALTLALEESPQTSIEYRIFCEDNEDNRLNLTNMAVRKLVSLDKVDFMFSMWPPNASVIDPYVEQKHIVHFSITWYLNSFEKYQWTCQEGPSAEGYTSATISLLKSQRCKRVAIASFMEVGSKQIVENLVSKLKKENIPVVFNELVMPAERDFRAYLLKLRETHPDALVQIFNPPQEEIFNRQMREIGYDVPYITGCFDFYSSEARKYIEGCVYPSFLWTTGDFKSRFKKRFGYELTSYAGWIYDSTKIMIQTVEQYYKINHRLPTHEELLALLKKPREISGLTIGQATIHSDGWMETPFVLRKIVNGKDTEIKP